MKGMTMDFAVTRIFELESKKEFVLHRKMLANYLDSIHRGLQKNKAEFLKQNNLTEDEMKTLNAEKRFFDYSGSKALKQFEVNGYEKMLERILDKPLKDSESNANPELQQRL
jgi:hypothetical protein